LSASPLASLVIESVVDSLASPASFTFVDASLAPSGDVAMSPRLESEDIASTGASPAEATSRTSASTPSAWPTTSPHALVARSAADTNGSAHAVRSHPAGLLAERRFKGVVTLRKS
jgi:hypothetical protein